MDPSREVDCPYLVLVLILMEEFVLDFVAENLYLGPPMAVYSYRPS